MPENNIDGNILERFYRHFNKKKEEAFLEMLNSKKGDLILHYLADICFVFKKTTYDPEKIENTFFQEGARSVFNEIMLLLTKNKS